MERNTKITVTVSNDLVTDQRMARICKSLVDMGYEVDLVGRKLHKSLPLGISNFKQSRLQLFFTSGPLFYLELNIRLFIYLLRTKPSIIYVVDADTALAGLLAKKTVGVKLIYDAHELFSEVPELHGRTIIKGIWKWIEKRIILQSDLRITVTESIAHYYSSLYGVSFNVIRNFSNPRLQVINKSKDKYILYQGALNKGRGLEELIEASRSVDIKIKIAGDGDLTQHLKNIAFSNTNIEFIGKLIPSELEKITANAWLGYNLLENISLSYYYSLSNKTFDYMHAGIPQLMSDLPEYVNLNSKWKCGVVTSLNAKSIISTIADLLNQPDLYASLCNHALMASKVMVWEEEAKKLEQLMKQLR